MIDEADIQTAYGDAYYRIAENLDSKNYYTYQAKAREYYRKAVHIREYAIAYLGLGKTCTALHYNKEAIDALNLALKVNPRLVECYFIKGKCCYELERPEEACSLYQNAIDLGFNNASVYNALGDAQLAMKRYIDALKVFNHVIEDLQEELAHAYCGRGIVLHTLEMSKEALKSFEKANEYDQMICSKSQYRYTIQDIGAVFEGRLRVNSQDASAYKYKGDVLLLLGERINDAIDAYTRAIEYGDRSAKVYSCRAKVYFRLGDYHRSLRDYRKALEIDPNHQPAQQGEEKAATMIEEYPVSFIKKFALWLMAY